MRISDWSSDVCSFDLIFSVRAVHMAADLAAGDGGKRRVDFPLFRCHDDAAFGVFMISGGKNSFSLLKFSPAFLAGALISVGYAASTWWLVAAGVVVFGAFWIFLGE